MALEVVWAVILVSYLGCSGMDLVRSVVVRVGKVMVADMVHGWLTVYRSKSTLSREDACLTERTRQGKWDVLYNTPLLGSQGEARQRIVRVRQ